MKIVPVRYALSVSVAVLSTLLGAEAALAQTLPIPLSGQVRRGVAFQVSLANAALSDELSLTPSAEKPSPFDSLEDGLLVGYKLDRFVIGLGLDFMRSSTTRTLILPDVSPEPTTLSTTTHTFVVYPEVQFAIARSENARAELYGVASAGLGTWGTEIKREGPLAYVPSTDGPVQLRARWRIAPGMRYWIDPHLALSLCAGVAGNHLFLDENDAATGEVRESTSKHTFSLFTQISAMAVF